MGLGRWGWLVAGALVSLAVVVRSRSYPPHTALLPAPPPLSPAPASPRALDGGELLTAIVSAGLAERASAIAAAVRPAARLWGQPSQDGALEVGASKVGGLPDVPPDFVWPEWQGKPLAFLAQLDLAELHRQRLGGNLPSEGLLSFFYDAQEQPWGFRPTDRGGWRVFHFRGLPLRRSPRSLAKAAPALALSASPETTLPDFESYRAQLGLRPDAATAYFDLVAKVAGPGPLHRLLGYPTPVQGPMQLDCQLAFNGIDTGSPAGFAAPRREALERGASEWTLLLQLDSDDRAGWMWGDEGLLYFWIRESDLRQGRFDDVWLQLQCG